LLSLPCLPLVPMSDDALRVTYVLMVFLIGLLATATLYLYWRIRTPLYELSPRGLAINNAPFAPGRIEAPWQEVIGMAVEETALFGITRLRIRLLLGSQHSPLRELFVNPKIVERSQDLLLKLREQIPLLTADLLRATGRLEIYAKGEEVCYGPYILSCPGIVASRKLIPWSAVDKISSLPLVLSGYGRVTIAYTADGNPARLTIAPKATIRYQDFIRTLLRCAPQSLIDPGVATILDCPPQQARKKLIALLLVILSVALTLGSLLLAVNY
jgi:hypothetical protein